MAGRIVVGVEPGEHTSAALEWAVSEARLRGASLELVHAWSFVPMTTPADSGLVPVPWSENVELLDAARQSADETLAHIADEAVGDADDIDVILSSVEGSPADALLSAAAGADLLVVGNRGRGNITSALLGSVSSDVADHAPCPVVIVRTHDA